LRKSSDIIRKSTSTQSGRPAARTSSVEHLFSGRRGLPGALLRLVLAALLIGIGGGGCRKEPAADVTAGPQGQDLKQSLLDLEGRGVDPFAITNAKALVFLFVSTECPISNRYAPEYRRLQERFAARGVKLWLVYPNADETAEAIRRHLKEFALPLAAFRDPRHVLVKRSMAQVTPEAAVFLPDGKLVYHGRIDDRFPSLGNERPEPTQRDLAAVLEAVLEGKPAPIAASPAVGCRIAD